jgi:hypothetical protein
MSTTPLRSISDALVAEMERVLRRDIRSKLKMQWSCWPDASRRGRQLLGASEAERKRKVERSLSTHTALLRSISDMLVAEIEHGLHGEPQGLCPPRVSSSTDQLRSTACHT